MAEHINNDATLLASGGHRWLWDDQDRTFTSAGSAGIVGVYSQVTQRGARAGRITGDGTGAFLVASGADKATADAAMTALIAAIEALINAGVELDWEDDQGHAGTALMLRKFVPKGIRLYSQGGVAVECWQEYELLVEENNGGW